MCHGSRRDCHICMGLFSAKGISLVQHGHIELFAALHLLYSRSQLVKGVVEHRLSLTTIVHVQVVHV